MKDTIIIYWARRDLRLRDNRALSQAVRESTSRSLSFIPLFCIEPYMTDGDPNYQFGYPSRYFLAQALPLFTEQFKDFLVVHERPAHFLKTLARTHAIELYVNEDIHPDFYTQLRKIRDAGVSVKLFRDQLTIDKETKTGAGDYYSVFTPFKKAVWLSFVQEKEERVPRLDAITYYPLNNISKHRVEHTNADTLLKLFSTKESIIVAGQTIDISKLGLPQRSTETWYFSEHEALTRFDRYIKHHMSAYTTERDMLADDATSRMSLGLAWGLISTRTLVAKIQRHFDNSFENLFSSAKEHQGALSFISELIWREFYKYLYYHNPKLTDESFQKKYDSITWAKPHEAHERFKLWIEGKTGYPIVDAAMMQLATTGWMHNRARMIVASILTKNLGVDWRFGQEYFRAMLVDLDEASNCGGWQWGASVGADPKPIRIFNPYLQAKNYDPENRYQTRWLSAEYQQNPPKVIIEHEQARQEALKRYGLRA